MSTYLDFHASDRERQEADRLAKENVITNGPRIHDLSVSCYTGTGEDGRPEDVHETRMSDGACRCGAHKARRWDVTLTKGTETVHTFTWGVRYSAAYARVTETLDNPDGFWEGWSFKIDSTPTLIRGEF